MVGSCVLSFNGYVFDFREVVRKLRSNGSCKRILLEAPQGMVQFLPRIAEFLSSCFKSSIEFVLRLEPAYGLCSLSLGWLNDGSVDCIVHIGHDFYPYPLCVGGNCVDISSLIGSKVFTVAGEYEGSVSIEDFVLKIGKVVSARELVLLYAAQHRRFARQLANRLVKEGYIVRHVAPVLGCYIPVKPVESTSLSYLVVAGGMFHSLGVALYLNNGEHVYRVDPYTGAVESIASEYRRVMAKRYWLISEARRAERFGVIVGLLPGQYRPGIVSTVTKLLKNAFKKYSILYVERLSRDYLDNLNPKEFDAFIITSCPRLAIDDLGDYWKPVLTPGELLLALSRSHEKYIFPW